MNGKLRARIDAPKDGDRAALEALAREAAAAQLDGKDPRRVVVVPGRLVNFVL